MPTPSDDNPPVQLLDRTLIDQIAAGEVVERPASVIKELLENAVDAHATRITVETEGGGVERIRVTDNGIGMSPENAKLAVLRHATSKISEFNDLMSLRTLGFRGEALPSIASVSRFSLHTRTRDSVAGTSVCITGGNEAEVRDIGCAPGTCVEAADLFFNVPARRKFLKATPTEHAHITEVVQRLALAHPEVHITLLRNGRSVRDFLPASTLAERAQQVFPNIKLAELEDRRDGIHVHAMLSPPERSRSGAGSLHLFVNERAIRDRRIARAIAFAYGSVLPPGRYPVGVVHLRIPPEEADVNVHPQKSEVRFQHARLVLDTVTRILARGLGSHAFSRNASTGNVSVGIGNKTASPSRNTAQGAAYWADRLKSPTASRDAEPSNLDSPRLRLPTPGTDNQTDNQTNLADSRAGADYGIRSGVGSAIGRAVSDRIEGYDPSSNAQPAKTLSERSSDSNAGFYSQLRVLGQAHQMLIVCEGPTGLLVLDQHAADERVRYAHLHKSYHQGTVETQRLLFPERVELSPHEVAVLDPNRQALLSIGIEVNTIGESTAAVQCVPSQLKRASPARLLHDALAEMTHEGPRNFGARVDKVLATMACHASVRGGDSLSVPECTALLSQLDKVSTFQGHCPHGRPIAWNIGFDEIERKVGR